MANLAEIPGGIHRICRSGPGFSPVPPPEAPRERSAEQGMDGGGNLPSSSILGLRSSTFCGLMDVDVVPWLRYHDI